MPLWPQPTIPNQYATVEERHTFTPTVLNLARFSFVRTHEGSDLDTNEPGLSFFPDRKNGTLSITGLSPLGSSIFLPFYFVQNKFDGGDDIYWTAGLHNIRLGADIMRVQSNVNAPGWLGGEYIFPSVQSFLAAEPLDALGFVKDAPFTLLVKWLPINLNTLFSNSSQPANSRQVNHREVGLRFKLW